jgi:hypothetical protein
MKALWIGGPPGKTLDNIIRNLSKEGIDIVERWDSITETMRNKHRIPNHIEVILLNHEMCSHPMQDKIKDLCKKAHKPFILASLGSKRTILELRSKGILKAKIQEQKNIPQIDPALHPDVVKEVSDLVDERSILLTQKKGIEARISVIEIKLQKIREDLGI